MVGWTARVIDVKGDFLHGEFTDGESIYFDVPEGWESFYSENAVLL